MTFATDLRSRFVSRLLQLTLAAAAVVTGVISVYSDSRSACALWVTVALALAYLAGSRRAVGCGGAKRHT